MAQAVPGIEDRTRHGILLMLLAWFLFSMLDTSAKWVAMAGLPAAQIAFFRYAGHFAISLGLSLRDPAIRQVPPHLGLVCLRGGLLVATTVVNFYILRLLPLTVISAIMFSSPVIVCFLSVSVLKERVGIWRWSAIFLGFIGVLIVIRPFGESFHIAMLLAFLNACSMAIYSMLSRALAGKVSTDAMQFWSGLLGTVALAPLALIYWQAPGDPLLWLLLLATGVFGWAGHQWMTTAHRFATANSLMPFTYSYLLYLTVWSFLVFGHIPSVWTLLGAVVIMGSGLIIWYREGRA